MRIESKRICDNPFVVDCNNAFEWMVVVTQHMSSGRLEFERYDKTVGSINKKTDSGYEIKVACPKCGQYNVFDHVL